MITIDKSKKLTSEALRNSAIVPMLTPLTESGKLDEEGIYRLVEHIMDGGCHGVLVSGTTGEAASMSQKMRIQLANVTVRAMDGRGLVIFGIGHDSIDQAVEIGRAAMEAGADAVLSYLPSYFAITEPEMENWYTELANRIDSPTLLYNIPQMTGLSIPLAAVARLSGHPNIVGIKDSEANEGRHKRLGRLFSERKDFAYLCGAGTVASAALEGGAFGYTPAVGNLVPSLASKMIRCHIDRDIAGGSAVSESMAKLSSALGFGRGSSYSLCTMKAAASFMGLCHANVLPPLIAMRAQEMNKLKISLRALDVIK